MPGDRGNGDIGARVSALGASADMVGSMAVESCDAAGGIVAPALGVVGALATLSGAGRGAGGDAGGVAGSIAGTVAGFGSALGISALGMSASGSGCLCRPGLTTKSRSAGLVGATKNGSPGP